MGAGGIEERVFAIEPAIPVVPTILTNNFVPPVFVVVVIGTAGGVGAQYRVGECLVEVLLKHRRPLRVRRSIFDTFAQL